MIWEELEFLAVTDVLQQCNIMRLVWLVFQKQKNNDSLEISLRQLVRYLMSQLRKGQFAYTVEVDRPSLKTSAGDVSFGVGCS